MKRWILIIAFLFFANEAYSEETKEFNILTLYFDAPIGTPIIMYNPELIFYFRDNENLVFQNSLNLGIVYARKWFVTSSVGFGFNFDISANSIYGGANLGLYTNYMSLVNFDSLIKYVKRIDKTSTNPISDMVTLQFTFFSVSILGTLEFLKNGPINYYLGLGLRI